MSPNATTYNNDILTDENYYLWEFADLMTIARKEILDHIAI